MKKAITIIAVFLSASLFGVAQTHTFADFHPTATFTTSIQPRLGKVISKYDTTVLFNGIEKIRCFHNYVSEIKPISTWSCAVLHDEAGCPDTWLNEKQICIICLRHIQVVETRTFEPKPDPYTEALERLNKLKNK